MNLLFIGGTNFVGRHLVETALARGHEATLFNRGQTNPDLFPQVEKLVGDRDGGLAPLKGRRWDAAIDVNGYLPRLVRDSASLLAGAVNHYTFISTLSVYADFEVAGQDEMAPLDSIPNPSIEVIDSQTYGPLKVLCEVAVEEVYPNRALIIRPGYIVGPHDHTDRFTSWLRRASQGGEMVASGRPTDPIQFVDARDLAAFTLDKVEEANSDIYNVTGPARSYTWCDLFDRVKALTESDTKVTWVSNTFLEEQDLASNELPMWTGPNAAGLMRFDVRKAIAAGLAFRPVSETILDTLAWDAEFGVKKAGLSPERESEILEKWRERKNVNRKP